MPEQVTDFSLSVLEITEEAFYRLPYPVQQLIQLYGHELLPVRGGLHRIEMATYRIEEIEAAMRQATGQR